MEMNIKTNVKLETWEKILIPSSVQSLGPVRLCNPMACSMPGLPVHHQLLELAQIHVIKSAMPSSHLILCCPPLLPFLGMGKQLTGAIPSIWSPRE